MARPVPPVMAALTKPVVRAVDTLEQWVAGLPRGPLTDWAAAALWELSRRLGPVGYYGTGLTRSSGLLGAVLGSTPECVTSSSKDCSGQDLSGADLHGLNLAGVNFTGANLSQADLAHADISGAVLTSADLSNANIYGASLAGADFNQLTGSTFAGANLSHTELQGAWLYATSSFVAARFRGADLESAYSLQGLNFTNADLSNQSLAGRSLIGVTLNGADLTGASLNGANLSGAALNAATVLSQTVLTGVDFSDASLAGTNLSGMNLSGANLVGADLTGVSLRSAFLTSADLTGQDLSRTDLTGAIMVQTNFTNADLAGQNLSGTNLFAANLVGADLTGADLRNANLSRADLTGAVLAGPAPGTAVILSGANLTGSNLTGTNLANQSFAGMDLTGANLTGATLTNGSFTSGPAGPATLTDVNLTGADATGADFTGVDLQASTLRNANLTNANFTGADLTGAVLLHAILVGTNFANAVCPANGCTAEPSIQVSATVDLGSYFQVTGDGDAPAGGVVSPDGTQLYVVMTSGTTKQIDTATLSLQDATFTLPSLLAASLNPSDTAIYGEDQYNLYILDTANQTVQQETVSLPGEGGLVFGPLVAVSADGSTVLYQTSFWEGYLPALCSDLSCTQRTTPPSGMALSPDGKQAYITYPGGSPSVASWDYATMFGGGFGGPPPAQTPQWSIPLPGNPTGVAVGTGEQTGQIYVAMPNLNTGINTVAIIDTATQSIIAEVDVPGSTSVTYNSGPLIAAANGLIYVPYTGDNLAGVQVIDPAARNSEGEIEPRAIASLVTCDSDCVNAGGIGGVVASSTGQVYVLNAGKGGTTNFDVIRRGSVTVLSYSV